ncbi:helix-turn-helix domain-containing protein [Vogesella mureinivorans]|uniref:helix-turn-helix domain-containing protein n=1 Tax=Vogesella mureinivorans TaxID=657276 RepID=UPI0011C98D77
MQTERTMDVHGAAAFLHVCPSTAYELARNGDVPATKVGRSWVFLESDLVNFLRAKQNEQRQKAQVGEVVKGEVCRSTKEERLGGAISQRQAERELDSLLARVTGRKHRNSTTS